MRFIKLYHRIAKTQEASAGQTPAVDEVTVSGVLYEKPAKKQTAN